MDIGTINWEVKYEHYKDGLKRDLRKPSLSNELSTCSDCDNRNHFGSLEDQKESCGACQGCIKNSNYAEWYMSSDTSGKAIQLNRIRQPE